MIPPSNNINAGDARKLSAVAHALAQPKITLPKSKLRRGGAAKRKATRIVEVEKKPLMVQACDLEFHPLLKRVGLLPQLIEREKFLGNAQGKSRAAHKQAAEDLSNDFESLIASIARNGLREKLKVVKKGENYLIVDGRHRFEAVREVILRFRGLTGAVFSVQSAIAETLFNEGLPCEEVAEADVVPIIMDAVNRRHLSKGARAYLAVMMRPEVAIEAIRGKHTSSSAISADELANQSGVSTRLIEDAIWLYRSFAKRADIRKKFEDAIWVGAGLAKLKAGIEGFMENGIEPDEEPETEEQAKKRIEQERIGTALQRWVGVTTSLKHWDTLPPDGREEITRVGIETMLAMPESFRTALSAALLGGKS